ncbi:MAG: hypothetical protein FJZ43_01605 [Candidatus Staskawiczbacteria bacterium]|nr:hypothetical protein [Candidatus Staskawiczbacteria bacterium]
MKVLFLKKLGLDGLFVATSQRGQIMLLIIILITVISFMLGAVLMYTGSQVLSSRNSVYKEQGLHIAEAGAELAIWKLNNEQNYNGELNTAFGNGDIDIVVENVGVSEKEITVMGYIPNKENPAIVRSVSFQTGISSDAVSFNYGVHVGEGGLEMNNGSKVIGNVFSNGNVFGGLGTITNDLIVAGNGHSVDDITVNEDTISYSCLSPAKIKGNLTYVNGGTRTCTVTGSISTQSAEIQNQPLPILQSQIDTWKSDAENGGIITGDYTITNNQSVILGPKKITGKLTISNNSTLVITGTIYVVGNILFDNNSTIELDSSYGSLGGIVLSDGKVETKNNASLNGSGQEQSYILVLSTNTANNAIVVDNNATGAIFYASAGGVELKNNVRAKEITGYKVKLNNNAIVEYETGLSDLNFTSGPGGSWEFIRGTYTIIK